MVLIAYGSKRKEVFIELSDVPIWYVLPNKHFLLEKLSNYLESTRNLPEIWTKKWSEFHLWLD